MIHYLTPYSLEKNIGKAYNDACKLIPDGDWICFVDADTMFLCPDFGHQIQRIVDTHPETGLFTCLTNRVGTRSQCFKQVISEDPNILNHKKLAMTLQKLYYLNCRELNHGISGLLMLFKKDTWRRLGGFRDGLLAVDKNFSNRILKAGLKIRLMQGVYIFHYYRLAEGKGYTKHLR